MKQKNEHILNENKVQKFMRDNWLFKNGWNVKYKGAGTREKGVDIDVANKVGHKFLIECKGSKNFESDFLSALGQICTRMERVPRGINFGIALPTQSAKIAVRRVPKKFAIRNNLNVFSVSNAGRVTRYKPSDIKGG